MGGAKSVRRKRRRWPWLAGILAAGTLGGCLLCIPPQSFRQVKQPREGRVMNQRVALVYSNHYQVNMGGAERLHSFDIRKYAKIYLQLNTDGLIRPEDVFVPEPLDTEQILLVHTPELLKSLKDSVAIACYLEVPAAALAPAEVLDAGVLSPFRYACGGTLLAARLALKHGVAINLGGGYHHAKPSAGEGFCVYNDLAIAVRALQKEGLARRVLIVDLDVHQGNGTSVCLGGDPSVFIFDMFEADIYPAHKEQVNLAVPLPPGTGDRQYLRLLAESLPQAIERAGPDLVLFQAGCDVLAGDPLARLELSEQGIVQRDAAVIDACAQRGIPVAMVLGGGYSDRAWRVQYASVRRTIERYGLESGRPYPPRDPSIKEKVYTK